MLSKRAKNQAFVCLSQAGGRVGGKLPQWLISGLVLFACVFSSAAWAEYRHCNRAKRYASLSEQGKQELQRGTLVLEVHTHTASAYHIGYVYTLVAHTPELVMAVFTNYEAHKTRIAAVLDAKVEAQQGNYAQVRFVYDLPWPIPNSEYVTNNRVVQEGDTYLLSWDLHPSSPPGLSTPKYVEGYFRTQPVGPHTLIIYCNYVIPGIGLVPSKVNREGIKAMQAAVHDAVRWVDAIAAEPEQAGNHLKKLRAMLAREDSQRAP